MTLPELKAAAEAAGLKIVVLHSHDIFIESLGRGLVAHIDDAFNLSISNKCADKIPAILKLLSEPNP